MEEMGESEEMDDADAEVDADGEVDPHTDGDGDGNAVSEGDGDAAAGGVAVCDSSADTETLELLEDDALALTLADVEPHALGCSDVVGINVTETVCVVARVDDGERVGGAAVGVKRCVPSMEKRGERELPPDGVKSSDPPAVMTVRVEEAVANEDGSVEIEAGTVTTVGVGLSEDVRRVEGLFNSE